MVLLLLLSAVAMLFYLMVFSLLLAAGPAGL
jgi:hypothetical protein